MLKTRLKGRLGNQLFIYGFARLLVKKYDEDVLIYDRKNEQDSTWYSHLDNYKINHRIHFTSSRKSAFKMKLVQKIFFIKDKLMAKRFKSSKERNMYQIKMLPKNISKGLWLLEDGYAQLPKEIGEGTFFEGYFQSPLFLDEVKDNLLEELRPQSLLSEQEKIFLKQIEKCNSVCVTIRLGDYINNEIHQVCSKLFYINAMKKMKELQPDCKFFIFSDEVEKAEEIFDFEYPVIYDSGKMKDYISLEVMSHCKHFIISNSSFSWWAQYLSQSSHKIVIAPDRWYANEIPCDIYEQNWILMPGK
ncbi:alpha-1,2-fucosyltransferase [Liquorilactobacillus hordei]|uniref:alpha-1,2-fucosyltransferase n=1 Tax=Liquorilactobacillus hordei TaxID=468911 RepID=UPI0039E7CB44